MERTPDSSRIISLDILRGIALFGMIIVHFHQTMEIPADGVEDVVGWVVWMGLETKAWATFAFLFGAGFAILIGRAEARGLNVTALFLRRMLGLAIFGIAVQLLFGFRILLDYALWGIPLLLVRKWSTGSLLVIAFVAAIAPTVYSRFEAGAAKERREIAAQVHEANAHGTFAEAVRARAVDARWTYLRPRTLVPDSNFVLFIFGLIAIRLGIFHDPRLRKSVIVGMMSFGFVFWAAYWIGTLKFGMETGFGIVSDQWLAFTYVGAIILLLAYRPVWRERLSMFAIAGRMALTNYVLQAAILSLLSSGYGFGVGIRPYYEVPAAAALFSVLVLVSIVWQRRFRYGPLEWVWRWLTYLKQANSLS